MKRFWWKAALFTGINLIILLFVLVQAYRKDDDLFFHFSQTESVLNSLPENQAYDVLIMGSSHGRIFSRSGNHYRVEQVLGKKVANISRSAAGILPEKAYLDYFYTKGNSAKTIVYFIDPFVFSTRSWNERQYFLTDEPFEFGFLPLLFKHGIDPGVSYAYIKSKFGREWRKNHGIITLDETYALKYIVQKSIQNRLDALYPEGYSKATFDSYVPELEKTIRLAQQHQSRIIFIIPATLLGHTPGHADLLALLDRFKAKYQIPYYDYANVIRTPGLFYNHDHLNVRGVGYFTERYLKPVLDASASPATNNANQPH